MSHRVRPFLWLVLCLGWLLAAGAEDAGRPQGENLALGKSVQFNTPPNYTAVMDADDARQLTDGKFATATPMWYDKDAVGWVLVDPTVFTLDLGAVQPIGGVGLHKGAGQAGVEWPASIEIHVSEDGKRYSHVGDVMQSLSSRPPATGYAAFWLVADKLETHGRFVKFVCSPTNLGNGAYIMLDEVVVTRGDAALLGRPLAWPEAPEQWRAPWSEIRWRDHSAAMPPSERPTRLLLVDGKVEKCEDTPLQQVVATPAGIRFTLKGEAGRPRSMAWTGKIPRPISTEKCRYALLTFRADGVRRTYDVRPLVALQGVNEGTAANDVTLLEANMALNDGRRHTLVKPLPAGFTLHQIRVALPTENDAPSLTLERLELLGEAPAVFNTEIGTGNPDLYPQITQITQIEPAGSLTPQPPSLRPGPPSRPREGGVGRAGAGAAGLAREGGVGRAGAGAAGLAREGGVSPAAARRAPLPWGGRRGQGAGKGLGVRDPAGFVAVNLGGALNGTLAAWFERVLGRYGVVLDGARALPAGQVHVSGVPFVIAAGERNLALMPETPEANEKAQFCGQTVDSRNLGPQSRDDALSVAVGHTAREAFLLIALAAPPVQPRGGLPYTALRLDDIECLSVELTYDRGAPETAFPYSLADRGCYLPARELGAYAVAVDPSRRLKRITLRSHQFGLGFALAGLTLNTSGKALVPELAALVTPEQAGQAPAAGGAAPARAGRQIQLAGGAAPASAGRPTPPAARPAAVTVRGRRLTFSNRWYEYGFDLAQGFVLDRFTHRANGAAQVRIASHSGLRVRVGDTLYTGRCFAVEVARTTRTAAELRLTSTQPQLPLAIAVTITAHDSPELSFVAEARNLGSKPLAAEICLPALAGLSLGDLARTRLFFPQYRNVDTAGSVVLRAPYGPEFSTQFMDVYNPREGIGLMVRTDNQAQRMADFALRKDASGVAGGVCFPAEHHRIDPGASRAYPPVSLFAHGGDWHAAFDLYRKWLRTWYKPHKSQDEAYFLNAWDLQCYRTSEKLSWREAHTPAFISPEGGRFLLEETFALEKKRIGHVPDLIHFYNWTHNSEKDRNEYGVYGGPLAYAQVGGLESFRRGIAEIQEQWGRPVSLYTLNDRFRASALPDQALSKELAATAVHKEIENDTSAALRGSGQADGIIFPPFGHPKWTDYFVNDIAKMQRDTGCKIVYMDVMPRFSHLRGEEGVTPREDDVNVVRRVREALPDDVALWTEYPFTDVASQYADGCLQYYFLELHQTFARRYNGSDRADDLFMEMPLSIGRYALTRYRTFGLPGYIEASNKPGQVDAIFLNGEPFHEDTFRLHHSRPQARINRAYVVKRQYADCFSSENPTPWVETAASGLTANLFPGKSRRLWTVFNGRPRTYSGVVLVVPHRPGAKYRDAWNGVPLRPAIANGMARIALTLDPQQPGCVVQE